MEGVCVLTNELDLSVVGVTNVSENAREKSSNIAQAQEATTTKTNATEKFHASSVVTLGGRNGGRKAAVGGNIVEAVEIKFQVVVKVKVVIARSVVWAIARKIDNGSLTIAKDAAIAASERWGAAALRHLSSWMARLRLVWYWLVGVLHVMLIVLNATKLHRSVVLLNRTIRFFRQVNHIRHGPLVVVAA